MGMGAHKGHKNPATSQLNILKSDKIQQYNSNTLNLNDF